MKNKNIVITGVIVLVLVIVGAFLTSRNGSGSKKSVNDTSILPENEVIPTVDSSVIVTVSADKLKHEATISVEDYPDGTTGIEYALSYDATVDGEAVPKGVIGSLEIDKKSSKVSKIVTLGTCSSGTCKYDKILGKVSLELKFQGDYGSQLYQGSFDL